MAGNDMVALVRGWSRVPGKIRTINRLARSGLPRGRKLRYQQSRKKPWTLRKLGWELLLLPVRLLAVAIWIGLIALIAMLIFN